MSEAAKGVLLIVDDEPLKRVTLQIDLTEAGYTTFEAADAPAALRLLDTQPVDAIVTDLRMPEMDGIEFLRKVKTDSPQTHVIVMTAYGSVDSAVEALKRGAYDYLTKPFSTITLIEKIDRLLGARCTQGEILKAGSRQLGVMIGRSHSSCRLFDQVRAAAEVEQPVLIYGESGTGKDRAAEAMHELSQRSGQPLVKFSCVGTDPVSMERDLFGAGQESSTGSPGHPGQFELAHGGTLMLDQVEELPLNLQARLLRALDRSPAGPSGNGDQPHVLVRLICGTCCDLQQQLAEGRFRQDLYYRISAVTLTIAPLRDRPADIPLLANHFSRNSATRAGKPESSARIHPHAIDTLMDYHWPGNVRELEHVMSRAVSLARGEEILPSHIQLPIEQGTESHPQNPPADSKPGLTETVAGVERTMIDAALRRAAGNQAKAAQFLGIPRTTLRDKMAKYGMAGEINKRRPLNHETPH